MRKAFYSFHYGPDSSRAALVRNMGVVEGNPVATDHDWESIKRGGDLAIKRWIDNQMSGKSCCVVLIGTDTAGRQWVNYEIETAWNSNKGLLGIHIHNLKDFSGNQVAQGLNPFATFNVRGTLLSSIVKCYNPPYWDSKLAYRYISDNIATWIEDSISIRSQY